MFFVNSILTFVDTVVKKIYNETIFLFAKIKLCTADTNEKIQVVRLGFFVFTAQFGNKENIILSASIFV